MEHDRQGSLRAFALERGVTVVAGDATAYGGRVLVYDATGDPLQARWALARGLAYVSGDSDPEALAVLLFAGA